MNRTEEILSSLRADMTGALAVFRAFRHGFASGTLGPDAVAQTQAAIEGCVGSS